MQDQEPGDRERGAGPVAVTGAARIRVTENGPYEVEGAVPLAQQIIEPNEDGESWEWREGERYDVPGEYRLCRCGATRTPPFCDGSEERIGFDGTETAGQVPYLEVAVVTAGPRVTLTDAPALCAKNHPGSGVPLKLLSSEVKTERRLPAPSTVDRA